ncbi:MAG: Gfo/Idh/MocA family protein, partial [Eubacteriales bacterium]
MYAVRFGIVGCGHIAKKHVSAIENIENANLIAVCDNNINYAKAFAEQYRVSAYTDYDEFILDPGIDAVIICTPSGLHASMGEKAADHGKHLLVEKPFVLDLHDGARLIEVSRKQGIKLGVVHPNRMKPVVQALYRAIKEDWFGKITHVNATLRWNRGPQYFQSAAWRGTRALDGGILFNQAIHNIDLLNWLV